MKDEFNKQINGLRAVLCIMVLVYHFCNRYFEIYKGYSTFDFVVGLQSSVNIFLIISGFFLTYNGFKYFLKSKLVKIIVPSLIAITIVLTITLIAFKTDGYIGTLNIFMNYLLIPMYSGRFVYVDGAHWYIVYLVYFYIVFCLFNLIAALFHNQKLVPFLMLAFAIISISFFFVNSDMVLIKVIKLLFSTRFIYLLMGYFFKLLLIHLHNRTKKYIVFFSAVIFLLYTFTVFLLVKTNMLWSLLYEVILIPAFVLCCFKKLTFFEISPFQIFGSASFFVYLLHQKIGYYIIDSFGDKLRWVGIVLAFLISITIGFLFCYLYKKVTSFVITKTTRTSE